MAEKSFVEEIEKCIASGEVSLPVFSPTALKVQQELVKAEPDIKVLENLITGDQSLSSQILRMANSAFYRGLIEVLTVKAAIIRLGMQEVGRIALLAASKNQFQSKDPAMNELIKHLWQHSAGCAIATHWLAKRCKFGEILSQAFFAGLLHDVGKLFVLTVIERLKNNLNVMMTHALLLEALDTLHTQQGYALMQRWSMPEQYCRIARDHHAPDFDHKDQLLVMVRLADMMCHKLGIGLTKDPELNLATTIEASILELSEISLAELEVMLEDTSSLLS